MIVTLEQDAHGELILPLGDDLCKEVGWQVGDTISFADNGNGSWSLTKKEPTKIVLIDTVVTYRMRYAVEILEDAPVETALSAVSQGTAVEFSQQCGDERITLYSVITPETFLKQFDIDNDYLAGWTDEQKFNAALTKVTKE